MKITRRAHDQHRPFHRGAIPRVAVLVAVCLLASCTSVPSGLKAPDLAKVQMDPQKFMTITLRNDIEIETVVIRGAPPAMARTRWLVLQYVEQENKKGFVPHRESEYANLYLVRAVEAGGEDGGAVRDRYLVVELWHYYPGEGIKTCHQWTVWEDDVNSRPTRGSFRMLVEDFDNVFLGEGHASLETRTVELLGEFYLKVKEFFTRRVKDQRVVANPADARDPAPSTRFWQTQPQRVLPRAGMRDAKGSGALGSLQGLGDER